jgi:hypothetical protein
MICANRIPTASVARPSFRLAENQTYEQVVQRLCTHNRMGLSSALYDDFTSTMAGFLTSARPGIVVLSSSLQALDTA